MNRAKALLVRSIVMVVVLLNGVRSSAQPATGTPATNPAGLVASKPGASLYERYMAEYKNPNFSDPSLVVNLATAPDGDLFFLKASDVAQGDWRGCTAREQLGKLNTQRTFDVAVARLKSDNPFTRENGIQLVSAFKRPECVPLLAGVLRDDLNKQVRQRAAEALALYADARSEEALLKAAKTDCEQVAIPAAGALGAMNSRAGFETAVKLLRNASDDQHREFAIQAVGAFRTKPTVETLLKEYGRLLPRNDGWAERLMHDIDVILNQRTAVTFHLLGPKPDTLEQWRDLWSHAEPLLTDDLQLKARKKEHREYRPEEFGKVPGDLVLTAAVDAAEYRVGDPIRLELRLANRSERPYSVVRPKLPSGWWPTMAYGIRLYRGETPVLDLAPSDFYQGSYSGPPKFETLAPSEEFVGAICLQHFVGFKIGLPLAEGQYELKVTFDSSKFHGIMAKGVQLIGQWQAKPVTFVVKGPMRKDPADVLRLVGEKTGLRWIESDLTSPQLDRRTRAWQAVFGYGDSRLEPLIKKIEVEHPEKSYHYLSAKDLSPYESRATR